MMFIVTVALLVARDKRLGKNKYEPVSALRLFNYCLIAALLCAIVGAIGSVSIDSLDFWPLLADWFSEQFSTGRVDRALYADVGNSWSAAAL
ncbi:putative signal transduction protein [Escherichia coli]|uniref:Putative signal transduction protein n=1 Tax=Escherichia coli TaxID=562 RepID=A0A377D412_ECOLX|nr:putative signal transduction protein [Escherichia coli]